VNREIGLRQPYGTARIAPPPQSRSGISGGRPHGHDRREKTNILQDGRTLPVVFHFLNAFWAERPLYRSI